MRRILCLYLPNWPIQRVRAERRVHERSEMHQTPSKKARQVHFVRDGLMHPTILHTRDPRRGLIVVACDATAASAGVRPGMPLAEAMTLAEKVQSSKFKVQGSGGQRSEVRGQKSSTTLNFEPGTLNSALLVLPHDPAADLAELARLAEHCERFSPLVGWETVEADPESKVQSPKSKVQPDLGPWTLDFGLFLDIAGIGVLFGGEDALAREAVADLARLGYTARAAVADTIGAAWAASRFQVPGSRFQVLDSSTLNLELGTWNLQSLRLPSETLDLLAQLGLTRLDELLALPRSSLRARFGERLLLRLDQLTGAAQEVIVPYRPPPKFAAEWVFEYPVERRDIVEQIVRELVGRVAAALAERREGVVQLRCRLDCGAGLQPAEANSKLKTCPTRIDVGLFRPSADARHLWDLVRMQLEQIALPGPVGRVTLQAVTTAPLENRQGELFAGGCDEADRQLAPLIDRLTCRLGPAAVHRPQLTADPLPERAVRNGFKVQGSRFKVGKLGTLNFEHGTLNCSFRPLFLRPPLELEVVSIVPDGPPITFHYAGRLHRVAWHWGPERIETGWFRGASVRRDYYRVQTEEGLRFWLFRRLGDEKWCLHGEFS